MKIPKFENFNEDYIPVGFGMGSTSSYSMVSPVPDTGYNMGAIVGPITKLGNAVANEGKAYEENENPDHTMEGYLSEAKKYVCEKLDEACGYDHSKVNEEEQWEFNAQESYDRLKRREEMNIRRFRAAQDRGDNYAIKLYELRIKMDAIDKKKIEIQTAIAQLDKKYGKDGQ